MTTVYDLAIVGGGLAGLVACHQAASRMSNVLLVDRSYLEEPQRLGGFAAFSGAKFSLYPAGRGLEVAAGGSSGLIAVYAQVLEFLGCHSPQLGQAQAFVGSDQVAAKGGQLRTYQSVVLSPDQISDLIHSLSHLPPNVTVVNDEVGSIIPDGVQFSVRGPNLSATARYVVVGAGRLGSRLLASAGCEPQEGKGLDVGVRLEFPDRKSLSGLRSLGPDAKILRKEMRTFCLNSPGTVYHYPWEGVSIPGGVVAADGERRANVGLLRRCPDKARLLPEIVSRAQRVEGLHIAARQRGPQVADPIIPLLFGEAIAEELEQFQVYLSDAGFIDFGDPYLVHRPLLDWHWPVFGLANGFGTSVPGLYAVGDASGLARGLLQAAVTGWLCAEQLDL